MNDTKYQAMPFPWPGTPHYLIESQEELARLRAENIVLKEEMRRREESAYEHGLGSVSEVYRQNKLLVQLVAGLTDPANRLNQKVTP